MTPSRDDQVPAGFSPHFRRSPLTDPWEPLFSKIGEASVTIALRARPAHCNGKGFLHGGLISSLADNAMGLSVVESLKGQGIDRARRGSTESYSTYFPGQTDRASAAFIELATQRMELWIRGVTPEPFGLRPTALERNPEGHWHVGLEGGAALVR